MIVYIPIKNPMHFRNFRHKAIERTVDAYQGLTPEERFIKCMTDNHKCSLNANIIKQLFKNHKL